jgi:hypothetical protein
MNNQTQTATRTLYLPCTWLGYIDYQCATDSETIWEINSTLGTYKGYGVKISEFVEITEDQPFLYDYNGSGHPVPCYEYIFQDTREGYQPIEPDLLFAVDNHVAEVDETTDRPSLDSPSGQRTAQLNDILTNQLEPLVNDIINEFSGSILPDELDQLLDRLSVLLDDGTIPPKRFRSMN